MYQIIEKRVLHHEFHDYIILLLKKKKKLEQDSEQLEREVGTVQEKKKGKKRKERIQNGEAANVTDDTWYYLYVHLRWAYRLRKSRADLAVDQHP